jgi:hypothetical protein
MSCVATAADSNLSQEIVGRWRGLRTFPGAFAAQTEILVFAKDGTFVSENPFQYKSTYKIVGDKVVLSGGREFRYAGDSLVGYQSVLLKQRP